METITITISIKPMTPLFFNREKKHQWVSWGGPLHHHQPAFGKFRMHHFEGQPMELRLRLHVQEATKDLPDFVGVSFCGQGNNGKKTTPFVAKEVLVFCWAMHSQWMNIFGMILFRLTRQKWIVNAGCKLEAPMGGDYNWLPRRQQRPKMKPPRW